MIRIRDRLKELVETAFNIHRVNPDESLPVTDNNNQYLNEDVITAFTLVR